LARDLGKMGQFLLERGNLAGAVQHLDRCVRICESQLGENHPTTVNRLNDLGKAFTAAGNAQRAAECFVKANERSRKRDSAPAPLQPMSSTSLDFEDMDMQLKPESEVWGE
jgi:tetratricopeptide (TPR) repeat protein